MNALNIFFNQQNGQNPTKRFSFFCVSVGRVPGIYSYWPEVLQQVDGIPSATWKGFHTFAEANQWANRTIGNNFYISDSTRKLNSQAALETAGFENNQAFNHSSGIKFCGHCETMTRNFKLLNEKNQKLERDYQQLLVNRRKVEEELATLKKKLLITEKELKSVKPSFTPLVKVENKQSSPLEDEDKREGKDRVLIELLQSKETTFLSQFPPEIIHHIQHLAREDRCHFQEFLFSELIRINQNKGCVPGLSITWKTLYQREEDRVQCPKILPTCIQLPYERADCTCQLIYSIPVANIDMKKFKPFHLSFKGKQVEITEATLLDFGYVQQIIFHNPEDTERFGRKLAICVCNYMAQHGKKVEAVVESKPPEWTHTGKLIPACHNIHLNTNPFSPALTRIYHSQDDDPWICHTNSIRKQLRHYIAFTIGEGFHINCLYNYGHAVKASLICEDQFQKIRSNDDIPEIQFRCETQYKKLVKHYSDHPARWAPRTSLSLHESSDNEDENGDEDYDFDDEAVQNLNNAMEG